MIKFKLLFGMLLFFSITLLVGGQLFAKKMLPGAKPIYPAKVGKQETVHIAGCAYKRQMCLKEKEGSKMLIGAPQCPECQEGNPAFYKAVGFDPSTGMSWCVNIFSGEIMGKVDRSPKNPEDCEHAALMAEE